MIVSTPAAQDRSFGRCCSGFGDEVGGVGVAAADHHGDPFVLGGLVGATGQRGQGGGAACFGRYSQAVPPLPSI